ncbi:MAG: hypothetical protein ACU0CB_14225 [Roseovarius sp.]|uniref:hypothetical protein n=1 Tax=Roseovarius sp. TaxID=1486281 RepID=UPI00262CB007|nr:hypothetical protein [Roseovarius sp.]
MPGSASDLLVKVVIVFLLAMAVLAMFGRLRFPGQKQLSKAKCRKCGRYRIGKGPCSCEKDKLK